ncbi:MAG: hypothetical protein AAF479_04950 [Pseudomonadota bacterium]
MRFLLITRPELTDTNDLFRASCQDRAVQMTELTAGNVGSADLGSSGPRLIYCAGADAASRLVEKLVVRPGDALLHDPHFSCDHQPILLRRSGIPMARAVYVPNLDTLSQQVDWLGGFPVVVKRSGFEGGAGVSKAGTLEDLTRQLTEPGGEGVMLEAFVPHVRCWRLTVLDGSVLAASASIAPDGDFRTNTTGGRMDPDAVLPSAASDIAIKAVEALRLSFGGVDLMESHDGTLTLAEVNFPCYFADQQASTGTDIAGAIVDHLHRKACPKAA